MKYLSIKNSVILVIIGAFAISLGFLSSCVKKDFDTPPVIIPYVDFDSNMTIDSLRLYYALHKPGGDTLEINQDLIIQGIVNSTDESGNIYKTMYIQDNTAGIALSIDQVSMYTQFKLGQRVYIKLKGLTLGTYGGAIEIGFGLYSGSTSVGRMPASMMSTHIYKDSLPGAPPTPIVIDPTSTTIGKYLCMLVDVPKASLPDAPEPFVIDNTTTNRNVGDSMQTPIMNGTQNFIIRTSNYANFSTTALPKGVGTLRGILSSFNGQFQMFVRDLNDLVNFDTIGVYATIYKNSFMADPTDWVKFSATGNNWGFTSQYEAMLANGYQGAEPTSCFLISPAIDLTGVSDPILTFSTWTQFTDSGLPHPLDVSISTNYSGSGDPASATWTPITCTLASGSTMTPSGNINLSAYHQKVYINFHYRSSGVTAASASKWEVDEFKVIGKK